MHFLLFYEFAPDYMERRAAFRDEHLRLAWEAQECGDVVLGGAVGEPPDGGMLLFKSESPAVAERFAAADPYVKNGLVKTWRVRKWTTVVGTDAAMPVRPAK
jgi:uncharacterized protein YciI